MPGLKRLLHGAMLLLLLCLPWTALAWLADSDAPPGEGVVVTVHATQATADGSRLRFAGGNAGPLQARLEFELPATADERWVLWLSRDAFDEVRVSAPGWSPRPLHYFRPDRQSGLLPAGYGFELPRGWTGRQVLQLSMRGGVRSAPTPRVLSERGMLHMVARDNALAFAIYAALLTLAITAVALYAAVRDGAFLMFAVHAGIALLLCGTVNGHLYGVPWIGLLGRLGASGFWATVLVFAAVAMQMLFRYVESPALATRAWLRGLPWALLAVGLLGMLPLPLGAGLLQPMATLGWSVSLVVALVLALEAARRGVSMAVAVLVCLLLLALCAGAHELMQSARLPDGTWTRYGYQLALVLLSVVLYVGLCSRIGQVRQRLQDESSARRSSESRLHHEHVRAALAQALQGELRTVADERIAQAAFRLLAEHANQLVEGEGAVVIAEGYQEHAQLLATSDRASMATLHAVQRARAAVRDYSMRQIPLQAGLQQSGEAGGDDRQFMIVPLAMRSPSWGALVLPAPGKATDEAATALVDLARTAMEQTDEALAAFRLRRTAEHDALTGSLNRRSLDHLLAREFNPRTGSAILSVLFIDLDWFKRVNDTLGHACGDECLRQVAAALRAELRPGDALGRYGGEEFLVVLPGSDAAAARVLAERLRLTVERLPLSWQGESLQLTVSIGLAARRAEDADPSPLLARADKALYVAKHEGRNCVQVAPAYSD